MIVKKTIGLVADIKDAKNATFARMSTYLTGDGSTPVIQTIGMGSSDVIGYNDDGSAILSHDHDDILKRSMPQFMKRAILEQKKLCEENGVDPDLVNMINAERGNNE